jgi:hypothetical protein
LRFWVEIAILTYQNQSAEQEQASRLHYCRPADNNIISRQPVTSRGAEQPELKAEAVRLIKNNIGTPEFTDT